MPKYSGTELKVDNHAPHVCNRIMSHKKLKTVECWHSKCIQAKHRTAFEENLYETRNPWFSRHSLQNCG